MLTEVHMQVQMRMHTQTQTKTNMHLQINMHNRDACDDACADAYDDAYVSYVDDGYAHEVLAAADVGEDVVDGEHGYVGVDLRQCL